MKYFYSSVSPNHSKAYKILVSAAMEHANEVCGNSLTLLTKGEAVLKWRLIVSPIIWLFLFKLIVTGKFFTNEVIHTKYKGYSVGRYAVPAALRDARSFESKLRYYLNLLKSIVKTVGLLESTLPLSESIEGAYLEHMCYSNGVLCEVFTELGIPIYHNHYPYSFVRWVGNGKQGYEDAITLPYGNDTKDISVGKSKLHEVINDTNRIPYMESAPFENPNSGSGEENYDYIIYCHSFTDAQNDYGYDGAFKSVYEWLEFTLETLKNKKVCLKAHPNFFAKGYVSEVAEWDFNIFNHLMKKYENCPNITIIDYALKNNQLLANVNNDAILVSHHGNALLEGGALGFKCIASEATIWRNYNLFNSWLNKEQYIRLLDMDYSELAETELTQLYAFCGHLYDEKTSIFGDEYIWNIVTSVAGCNFSDYLKDPSVIDGLTEMEISDIKRKISIPTIASNTKRK